MDEVVVLRDGATLRVRDVRADDELMLKSFFDGLSAQSRYLRFQHATRGPSARDCRYLYLTDLHRGRALVGVEQSGAEARIVADARYFAPTLAGEAEVAVVVADEWQSRGLGTILLRCLVEGASQQRVATLFGNASHEHFKLRAIGLRMGARRKPTSDGTCGVRIEFTPWIERLAAPIRRGNN
jgi:GNAT superfamily N-acetyltransferase